MKSRSVLALCLALAPSLALGQVITQTVPFDYTGEQGVTFPVLQGFDSLSGARQLTGVTFEFRHNFALDLYVESTGPTPVAAEDFNLAISYISLFQLGDGEHPPFFGPGAFNVDNASDNLAAFDGTPGNNGPDSYTRTLTDAFTITQAYGPADPDILAAVNDVPTINTVFGGFLELFVEWNNDPNWPTPPGGFPEYPNDASIWPSVPSLHHFGEIVVSYEYTTIPSPTAASLLALPALASLRRRRR